MNELYKNSERVHESEKKVPGLAEGIGTRISAAANLIGSRKLASIAAGVSPDSLQRYIREEVKPPFEAMYRLTAAMHVSLEWLATGEGLMRRSDEPKSPSAKPVDIDLLQRAVEVVDDVLDESNRELASDKKAQLIGVVYDMYAESAEKPEKGKILQLVKLAA